MSQLLGESADCSSSTQTLKPIGLPPNPAFAQATFLSSLSQLSHLTQYIYRLGVTTKQVISLTVPGRQ